MKNSKKIYIVGIGGIGISAIARYYIYLGYNVFGSDINNSELIENLKKEGCNIIIGNEKNRINSSFEKIIYTEAVSKNNPELLEAKKIGIKIQTYPESLAEIVNNKKLIAVSGTHGKSTTTSLISLVLKDSKQSVNTIVGTILKEFGDKNTYFSESEYFVIEACEYKRSFLNYKPTVGIITNIELDHLDYYKDLKDYISAYEDFINNIKSGGFIILNGKDKNCKTLVNSRADINYIELFEDYFSYNGQKNILPIIDMKIPGKHILYDAHIAYIIGHLVGINDNNIINSLEQYNGVWRRMERIGITVYNNILMSDYGHHPTEISLTLKALKDSNVDKKILTVFQPHQYNRTLELLEDFKNCFNNTDELIIPNIYESRDSEEDKKKINSEIFVKKINHPKKINGENFENTLKLIENFEKENKNSIIILMGAGDIDNLRNKIKLKNKDF